MRFCLEHIIEVIERQGRRRTQLLDDLDRKREYWKLNQEALDGTVCLKTDYGMGDICLHDPLCSAHPS
jgi:hypothetical protein